MSNNCHHVKIADTSCVTIAVKNLTFAAVPYALKDALETRNIKIFRARVSGSYSIMIDRSYVTSIAMSGEIANSS